MELICGNPFRVLGLPTTATDREIAKRTSDLSTYAALGKQRAYEWDLPLLGPIQRTPDTIGRAARSLEQRESKLFHALFWFCARHDEDNHALVLLNERQPDAALTVWTKTLAAAGAHSPSSARVNRAALYLWLSTREEFNDKHFADALSDIGFAIRRDLNDIEAATLGQAAGSVHADAAFRRRVIDALVTAGQAPGAKAFGKRGLGMIKHFKAFPSEARDYARTKLTGPVVDDIERAIAGSASRRQASEIRLRLSDLKPLEQASELVNQLEQALGADDGQVQSIANKAVDELLSCSIKAFNDLDDVPLAAAYMDLATETPCSGQVKTRLAENEHSLREIRDRHELAPLFAPLVGRRAVPLSSLAHAETAVDMFEGLLPGIRARVGEPMRPAFAEESSLCSSYVLGFLIKHVNEAQEKFGERQDLASLREVVKKCLALMQRVRKWDMTNEAREHFDRNHETLTGIRESLANVRTAQPSRSGWAGWLLVIIAFIIYKSCSG